MDDEVISEYTIVDITLFTICFSAPFFLVVPIIPSYLYTVDDAAANMAKNHTTASPHTPSGTFQTIVSLYDNSVRVTSGGPMDSTPIPLGQTQGVSSSTSALTPHNSTQPDCPKADDQLLNENVKVGLLFASKATVQLITNPFIGPLTNRWVNESF